MFPNEEMFNEKIDKIPLFGEGGTILIVPSIGLGS